MQIILSATDEALAQAWSKTCGDLDFVQLHREPIFEVICDAEVAIVFVLLVQCFTARWKTLK
jgi:hypothetical protein